MNQKGLAPILIVLILAALVGGYLIYQKQTKLAPSPQPTIQPSPSLAVDPTANWKIYTDENREFTFKYPTYLKMVMRKFPYGSFTDFTDMSVKPDGSVDPKEMLYSQTGGEGGQGAVYIDKGFSLTAYRQQQEAAADTIKSYRSGFEGAQKITIDNRETYRVTRYESGGGYEGIEISVYVIDKERVYVIATNTFLSSKREYIDLFNQILSTFRFTQ